VKIGQYLEKACTKYNSLLLWATLYVWNDEMLRMLLHYRVIVCVN